MMNLNGELRDRFAAAWNVFFSLKLQSEDAEPQAELFPLVGAAVGLISALAAGFARLLFGWPAAALLMASLYLIRALAIGFITAGSPLILLFVFTCAYLVRMELVTCAADGLDPLLPAPEENPNQPFILTAATLQLIGLLSFHLKCFAAAVILLLLAKGIARLQKNSILRFTGRPTVRMFDLYGYSAETLLLLAGMIMA